MRVGVFDSGIGGLTVLKELVNKYPKNNYYYFGDNKNMPYGSKSKKDLIFLTDKIINFLLSKNVDIIVIACGTVSSNIYEEIKEKYKLPIYDIITPTINFINNSSLNKIGLIATTMTIKSKSFEKRISKNIIAKDCPLFVPIIENNNNQEDLKQAINEYFKDIPKDIDSLILGCTHYPILEKDIQKYYPNVKLINMGKVLSESIFITNGIDKNIHLYFSKINHNLINNIDNILPFEYQLEEVKNA